MTQSLPKLVVFDLDFTLWPFYVELNYLKPYRLNDENIVVDSRNKHVKHYQEVPEILSKLSMMNIDLALASRTSEIEGANQLVHLFGWRRYFKCIEIYPGTKVQHFKRFKKESGHDYSDMLFFDDDPINIKEVSNMKVTCVHVEDGISMEVLEKGLNMYRNQTKDKEIKCTEI